MKSIKKIISLLIASSFISCARNHLDRNPDQFNKIFSSDTKKYEVLAIKSKDIFSLYQKERSYESETNKTSQELDSIAKNYHNVEKNTLAEILESSFKDVKKKLHEKNIDGIGLIVLGAGLSTSGAIVLSQKKNNFEINQKEKEKISKEFDDVFNKQKKKDIDMLKKHLKKAEKGRGYIIEGDATEFQIKNILQKRFQIDADFIDVKSWGPGIIPISKDNLPEGIDIIEDENDIDYKESELAKEKVTRKLAIVLPSEQLPKGATNKILIEELNFAKETQPHDFIFENQDKIKNRLTIEYREAISTEFEPFGKSILKNYNYEKSHELFEAPIYKHPKKFAAMSIAGLGSSILGSLITANAEGLKLEGNTSCSQNPSVCRLIKRLNQLAKSLGL